MKLMTLACWLLPLSLFAAEAGTKVDASFYAFGYAPGHESVSIQTSPEGFEEIRLSTANIVGPRTSQLTEGALRIHSKAVGADGATTYPVISTAKLPAGTTRALVVLFPATKGSAESYRSLVFNHDLKDFPLGVYRLINLSPNPIRGSVARDYVEAKPGGIANLEPAGTPGSVVPVRFEFFDKGRWNLLTETRCAIRKDRRWLTCIYQDPGTGRMNIRSIPDRTRPVNVAEAE